MEEAFKINVYFSEEGEEIEKLISRCLINLLEKNDFKHSISCKKQL